MSSSKKIGLLRDFAAGVYQSLWTGDTFSHIGIFDPVNFCLSLFLCSSTLPPSPLPCVKCILYTRIQCERGEGYGVLGLKQINTCR